MRLWRDVLRRGRRGFGVSVDEIQIGKRLLIQLRNRLELTGTIEHAIETPHANTEHGHAHFARRARVFAVNFDAQNFFRVPRARFCGEF